MKFRKSFLIEAKYFIQDKYGSVLTYQTNARGKRIVSLAIKKGEVEISCSSYKEAYDLMKLLEQGLKETKGKWYKKPKKVLSLIEGNK